MPSYSILISSFDTYSSLFFFCAGLYATFIFQKPDPDLEPPLTTPIVTLEGSNNHDEASAFFLSYLILYK